MEIISKLGQTYIPPMAAIAAPAAATNKPQTKSVFQVDNQEDEVYNVKLSAEQIYLSSQVEASSIVIDTGSTYNLIGQQLLPVLNERLQSGGQEMKLEDTLKYFKFEVMTTLSANRRLGYHLTSQTYPNKSKFI